MTCLMHTAHNSYVCSFEVMPELRLYNNRDHSQESKENFGLITLCYNNNDNNTGSNNNDTVQ